MYFVECVCLCVCVCVTYWVTATFPVLLISTLKMAAVCPLKTWYFPARFYGCCSPEFQNACTHLRCCVSIRLL